MSLDEKPNVADSEPTFKNNLPVPNGSAASSSPDRSITAPKIDKKAKKWKIKRKWLGAGLASLLLLGGTGAYLLANRPTNKVDLEKLTVPVEAQNLQVKITASGSVVPVQSVNVSPKTQGRVTQLLVRKGDRVRAGQAIALMENNQLQAQVLQAQANLKEALARVEEAKTSRPEEIVQSRARLFQAEAALRQALNGNRPEEINQARARANQARAALVQSQNGNRPEEVNQARARLIQARAALAQAQNGSRSEEINQAIARVNQARASLAQARNGARPEEINQARAKVVQARAALAQVENSQRKQIQQTEAQLKSAQEKTKLSAIRVERYENLWQAGATSKDKYDEALTAYRTNLAEIEQIQQRLAELQLNLPTEVAQRQAAAIEAQQALQQVQNGTRPEEIAQKQAALDESVFALQQLQRGSRPEEIAQKQAAVLEAQQALQQVQRGSRPEEIAQKQAALDEAVFALRQTQNGTRPEEIAQKQADVAQAQASLRQAESGQRPEAVEQLRSGAAAAAARLREVQLNYQDSIIRAPFNGIITQEYATVGAFVTPTTSASSTASATSTAIFAIARDLEAKALVPEIDISKLKEGQPVEIVADAYPEKVFKGKVRLVSPEAVVEQNVTSFEVRVSLDTGQDELKSGMNATLTFVANELKNALAIPTVAILTERGKTGVLVVGADNKPEFRDITVGSSLENKTQVLEGLQAGERIFIETPEGYKPDQNNTQGNSTRRSGRQ